MPYHRREMEVNYEAGKDKRVKIYEFIINTNKSVKSLKQEYNYVGKKHEYYWHLPYVSFFDDGEDISKGTWLAGVIYWEIQMIFSFETQKPKTVEKRKNYLGIKPTLFNSIWKRKDLCDKIKSSGMEIFSQIDTNCISEVRDKNLVL